MDNRRLLLLDTASLYFRAFFGVPDTLRAPDGTPVNAVRGLLDFIARLIDDVAPTHLACCWDNDWRPQWRVDLIPSYKAHRVAPDQSAPSPVGGVFVEDAPDALSAQIPIIVSVLQALGLPIVGKDGYEADDVIGTLASTADCPVDIVTGDRDLFQLVDDARQIKIFYTARGMRNLETVTDTWVENKYGISPRAYVWYATLRGDTSDGLPGVPGIGEKTAASLLRSHGDLEGVLAAASLAKSPISPSVRAKLAAAIDYLAVAPTVVAVARDLDLGCSLADLALPVQPVQAAEFESLTSAWGLGGSAERVVKAMARVQVDDA